MSEIQTFPGAFVWTRLVPGHEEINSRMLSLIKEKASKNEDNTLYRWGDGHERGPITNYWDVSYGSSFQPDDIQQIAIDSLSELISTHSEYSWPIEFSLHSMWWNRYPPGTTAPPHVHGSVSLSGVYILEQDEDCPLTFKYQNHYPLNPQDAGVSYKVEARAGTCIMFPSALLHWVKPTKAWRTTISFNFSASNASP